MSIKDAKKINGFKYRSWRNQDGTWSDPFEENCFWSRTFLPPGTQVMEATSEEDMVKEVKKGNKKFKEKDLSEKSKVKFEKHKIKTKIEKDAEVISRGSISR